MIASFSLWLIRILLIRSFASSKVGEYSSFFSSHLIIWYPNCVWTTPLISPGSKEKAASSNSFTIWPVAKNPRSPPLGAEGPIDFSLANSAKSVRPSLSCRRRLFASSSVSTNIWRAWTCSGSRKLSLFSL